VSAPRRGAPEGGYLIRDVSIFDGSGSAPQRGAVRVRGERIEQVTPGATPLALEPGGQVIEGAGGTLMPGLIEAHAHLTWPSSIERIYHEFVLPPAEMKVAAWRNARILLDAGFTSAYSAGALAETIEVELREEIAAGRTPGPRLKASTIERSPEAAEGTETGAVAHGRGAPAMRAFIERCRAIGIDSVKLLISGEDALLPGSSQHILYTDEELAAADEAARAAGLWLAAHTQAAQAVKLALRHGVRTLYHCSYADREAVDMLESQRESIFVAPAIGVIVATLEAEPPPHVDMRSMKECAKPVIEHTRRLIPELKRRGVRVLPGGDYGFPFNPNGTNARDLEHFVELYDYTPSEALVAATRQGGELMGMGGELGQIRPGYLADLLLIDGDPTRDVRILQQRERIRMIMQGGRLHKLAPGMLSGAAPAAAAVVEPHRAR
jgi:imidazolonepropionase-like amidohydrolase